MKRLFFMIFMILMLAACGKTEEIPAAPDVPPEAEVTEEVTVTEPTVEVETEIAAPELPEETVITSGGVPVSYTSEALEGLVEDTVGYTFEIPTFDVAGAEAIRGYYADMADHLESYTKETVYAEAASRACVVSVYGYVTEALLEEDVLTVTYVYECDFSDTEESVENVRTDSFLAASGGKINN